MTTRTTRRTRWSLTIGWLALAAGFTAGFATGAGAGEGAVAFEVSESLDSWLVLERPLFEQKLCGTTTGVGPRVAEGDGRLDPDLIMLGICPDLIGSDPGLGGLGAAPVILRFEPPIPSGCPECGPLLVGKSARLCLQADRPIELSCGTFDLRLKLDEEAEQPVIEGFAYAAGETGGHFLLDWTLRLRADLEDPASGHSASMALELELEGAGPWASQPAAGTLVSRGPIALDSDCDGIAQAQVAAATSFFPGSDPAGGWRDVCFYSPTAIAKLCLRPVLEKPR